MRRRTRFAFMWMAVVPIALAAAAMWLSGQFRREVAWIAHTYEVRTHVRDVVQLVTDAEEALREYVLTGAERYSLALDLAHDQAKLQLDQLRGLTIDNPVQQENIRRLEPLVRQAFSEMQDTRQRAASRKMGAAFAADIHEKGEDALRRIRDAAREMMLEEERRLLARNALENQTSREVEATFVTAVLLTLALLFWTGRRLREYAAHRDRAEGELQHTVSQIEALNRELEARVEERTAQLSEANAHLARSNEDLGRFAYIASHDLQEPLRIVTLYAQLLAKSTQGMLDERSSTCVNNIIEYSGRMLELLKSLLTYAEMGVQREETTLPVDLNAVLHKVIQNLQTSIDETGAVISAEQLPMLKVDEEHFIQLFQNLIGNAIKYRGERPPRIGISVRQVGENLRFAVTDNGIGIEPEYCERIFVAFKRLHGRQIPGVGIGLAICKRVLDRYGGHIWAESQAGLGATFVFTLPLAFKPEEAAPEQKARSSATA